MGGSIDIAKELAALRHEKKNQCMKSLPPSLTVQRRPLHHAPVASPYAGAHVPKVVYVSCRTPIMSAVKRVKKLLSHVEKRALQSIETKGHGIDKVSAQLTAISDHLTKTNEEVLVKASGRAMSQALRVGEWFRHKEKEMVCNVEIRTGNVQAVDDIVAIEDQQEEIKIESVIEGNSILEGGDTTMELLGNINKADTSNDDNNAISKKTDQETDIPPTQISQDTPKRKRKRVRRKRSQYDEDDIPEARLRWVKTIEIAISLRP